MQKINIQTALPHLLALVIFLLVTVIYFKPVFFEHKDLKQHDIQQWEGGAKELLDYRSQTGEEALWTNSMFGGMPAYLITMHWGIGALSVIQKIITLGLPHPVRIVFLSFLSFYILLLVYGVRPYLAIAGAIAFGLSSFDIIGLAAGHNARITAIAYMPLVLAGIHLTLTRSRLNGMALTALALALHLHANHLQITYYLILMVFSYMMAMAISAIRRHQVGSFVQKSTFLLAAAVLAFGTFTGSFFTTLQYSKYSMRGTSELKVDDNAGKSGLKKDYAFQYSNGIFEPMTLMIPDILGGSSQEALDMDSHSARAFLSQGAGRAQVEQQMQAMPTYWGDQTLTAPYYAGAISCFLFVLGIFICERRTVVWIVAVCILGIMLSWGSSFSSFNYLMFDYFPGYNKFRSVTFNLIMTILGINLLGFLGLEQLLKKGLTPVTNKKLMISVGITGGLALLLTLFASVFSYSGAVDTQLPQWLIGPLRADRQSLLRGDSFRSFMFILIAFGGIWFHLRGKIQRNLMALGLAGLVLLDMWTVDKRYLNESHFSRNPERSFFSPTSADQEILKDTQKDYRVFNLVNPWNEARTSYYHKSIGGYHGAKIRRYQDVVDHCLTAERSRLITDLQNRTFNPQQLGVLNMLNVKYFVAGSTKESVIKNPEANGNAWFVEKIIRVNSPTTELDSLCLLDTKNVAVVDEHKFPIINNINIGQGTISLETYKPNYLKYSAEVRQGGLAVFSEIFYQDGWKATIDDQPAQILRANYILRAVAVPTGKHVIEFSFEPKIYRIGNYLTTSSSILLLLVLLGAVGWNIKQKFKKAN